jgi:hypothetical protein
MEALSWMCSKATELQAFESRSVAKLVSHSDFILFQSTLFRSLPHNLSGQQLYRV